MSITSFTNLSFEGENFSQLNRVTIGSGKVISLGESCNSEQQVKEVLERESLTVRFKYGTGPVQSLLLKEVFYEDYSLPEIPNFTTVAMRINKRPEVTHT